MQQNQTMGVRGLAAQLVLGGLALALVILTLARLHADLATAAFACLIVLLLLSLMGSFVATVLLSLLAVAGLDYFFAPPVFHVAVDNPHHLFVLAAFFLTALVAARLIGHVRREREIARAAEADFKRRYIALQESDQQWRAVFEHNPVMYFMVDAEGLVLNVNTFGATQLGYTVQDLVGQSVLRVFLPGEHDLVRKCLAVCLESLGQSHTWEIQKIRPDGSLLWVRENAKAMRRSDGRLVVLIACEDITERKATEGALQRSEVLLAQAQELSRTGSFGWNIATGEIYWSRETFRIFAYDPATPPSTKLVVERTHPEDRADVRAVIVRATREHSDFEHEYRLLLPDGKVKHVHALARAAINGAGHLEFVGAVTDITVAKEAEQKLRRSEAYLAEAQRLSHTSSWAWDVRRRDFIYRSAEFFRLFGFDPDENVPAQAIQDRIPPEDLELQTEVIRRAVKQKDGEIEFDFRIALPDGSVKRVHSLTHPVLDSDGEVCELIGTHMDVTEQYVAREKLEQTLVALRESEQRFRDYAETASDWLWETGPDHRVTQLSEHTRNSGVLAASVLGRMRWELATDAEAEKWREHRATLDAHLPFRDLVYRTQSSVGAPIYVRTSGKPFFDATGKFLGYRGVSTDLTAVIRADQAEQALRKAQAELAHVTRVTTLGELTASIAHEINQPLAAVIANAEACLGWLGRSPPNLAAARRSVEWIVDDANRASEVIRRVRALASKTDTEKALLDINALVREAMALVQRELAKNEVSLRMELAPRLPSIYGDRVQLQQVIINLVMNGIEAMQSVKERPRRLAIRSGQDDLGRVYLRVADTGTGICEADAERIFTPFFTTKSSGLGMGLAICRSIVEAHAGRLSVVRNEEGGATFQFVLPLHQEDAA
ncbi:PAS domain S-box protein [Bradyrhizobium sp. Tv2a-2]|uniref:PAS domain S-box protein n=1 Tax=Bradyrhizobium sp. Tv2a-2 TaxID=113395 RepID=UPI001FD9958A|nr:PAS domain S-box protein [Bradyrhizobium sp. Tv2a-2]